MATIKDVAKKANVSIATVSNYISGKKRVSEKNSDKIFSAIESLNYIPNQVARNLKLDRNDNIALILPDIYSSYYQKIFESVQSFFTDKSYTVTIATTHDVKQLEKKYIEDFLEKKVSGFIMVTCNPEDTNFFQKKFVDNNIPLVLIDRNVDIVDISFLGFKNDISIYNIVNTYIKENKTNICLFCGDRNFSCENDAVKGYIKAFEDDNIEYKKDNIISTILTKESAFRTALIYLNKHKPDVIVTTSPTVTEGIIECLSILGYKMPGDIIVATLGVNSWNKLNHFNKIDTTSRIPFSLGKKASEILYEQIKTPKLYTPQYIMYDDKFIPKIELPRIEKNKYNISLKAAMLDSQQVDLFECLLPFFKNEYGIDVSIEKIPHNNMLNYIYENYDKLDIIMYDMPWLFTLAEANILSDITDDLYNSDFDKSVYLDKCIDYYGKYKSKYYGLPFIFAPQILFYRKDIFEDKKLQDLFFKKYNTKLRPPRIWQEFNIIAEFFTKKNNPLSPTEYGTAIPGKYVECFAPDIYIRLDAYGSELYDKKYNVTFNSRNTIKAVNDIVKLIKTSSTDYKLHNDMTSVDEFIKGNIAMIVSYPSFITNVNDLQESYLSGNIGYAHVPTKDAIFGGWGVGISEKSKNKESAYKFIKWVCDKKIADYCTIMAGQSAVCSTMENNELSTLYPWISIYKDAYKYSRPLRSPVLPGGKIISRDKINTIICNCLYRILEGKETVESSVERTHGELLNLFNK